MPTVFLRICPTCGKDFFTPKGNETTHCSLSCSAKLKLNNINSRAENRKIKKIRIPCIGPLCRGEREFLSRDPITNKLCVNCKASISQIMEV